MTDAGSIRITARTLDLAREALADWIAENPRRALDRVTVTHGGEGVVLEARWREERRHGPPFRRQPCNAPSARQRLAAMRYAVHWQTPVGREERGVSADLLRDLARAKTVFQLRAIQAIVCADARSKPDQETAIHPPPASEPQSARTPHQTPPCRPSVPASPPAPSTSRPRLPQ